MRRLKIYLILSFVSIFCYSQAPDIEWQKTIGGDLSDNLTICQTSDGGYIVGGSSQSGMVGDKTDTLYGGTDYWILKLNSIGYIYWQKTFGGSSNDDLFDLIQTSDGGYLLSGSSMSGISGNKTEETVAGSFDYWIIKLDSLGELEWQKNIGGAGNDQIYSLTQSHDGGFILGGWSNSPISGDKTEASISGSDDYWIVKLDSLGNIEWQNTIGGTDQDWLYCISSTSDNNFIVSGRSSSGISGDKTNACFGSEDFWVLKIDSVGNILWQVTLGGNMSDWGRIILQTFDNGYIVGGLSDSGVSGNKTEPTQGDYDYWVVKLDSSGNIQWQKDFGGNLSDVLTDIQQTTDEGYILSGYSSSGISGDKTEGNIGFADYWTIKIDNIGNILWQETIGGWAADYLLSCQQTGDGGYIVGGWSNSPASGDKAEDNNGYSDFWIVKLFPDSCEQSIFYEDADNDGFGGPSDSVLACFAPFGYIANADDCNDTLAEINPGMSEVCNGIDDNCNGDIDEGLFVNIFYADADNDGYGNSEIDTITCLAEIAGFVSNSTDCDDENNTIHEEVLFFADNDGDGFGNAINPEYFCSLLPPAGFVTDSTDCDDTNADIYPGALELQNGIDDNCNEIIDEGFNSIQNSTTPDFLIYPNPNNGFFEIRLLNFNAVETNVHVFDMTGNEIYSALYYNELTPVYLPTPATGMYGIYVSNGNHNLFKILFIQTN